MIMFSDKASDQPNCSALELEVVVTPWVDEQEKYISRASLETRSKVLALVKVTLCVTNLRHAMLMKIVVSLVCGVPTRNTTFHGFPENFLFVLFDIPKIGAE